MKMHSLRLGMMALLAIVGTHAMAQLPKIPKVPKVTTPSLPSTGGGSNSGGSSSGGSNSGGANLPGGKDESGLFSNITDDQNAYYHRKTAVENLNKIDAEYKKTSINYYEFKKLVASNEVTLGHIMKLEPKVDRSKYDERYLPLKNRADKEFAAYDDAVKLESLFQKEFNASEKMITPDPLTFRTDTYGAKSECYCRNYDSETKTLADFEAAKKQYDADVAQLVGYSDDQTQKIFANMATCLKNGNAYAMWAAGENFEKAVAGFNTENTASKPKRVIERCEAYSEALGRIESDYSIRLDDAAKSALSGAKAKCAKIKADNEEYISSGRFQAYLDKVHAEEIAKVFLPKAATKNSSLEAGAIAYIKGSKYAEYIKGLEYAPVSSTVRAVTLTTAPYVHKNDYGIPLYQYHELAVAFKTSDGKCWYAMVYANYTYKGGGTYETVPNWGADEPEEMACGNIMK